MYELRHPKNFTPYFSNGCGPKGLGWLVPDTVLGVDFKAACDIHDWMYIWGETEQDKREADWLFLKNMFRLIAKSPIVRTQQPLKRIRQKRAMQYYIAVKTFGDGAFNEGKI